MILGLDLATKTGYAVVNEGTGAVVGSGVWDLSKSKEAIGKHNGHMFLDLLKRIGQCCSDHCVGTLCYERAHFRGGPATRVCVGLSSTALLAAAGLGLRVMDVPTMTLKKFATGDYRAGKDAMKKAAKGWLGREPVDSDEADACAVSMWALAQLKEEK